MKKHKLKIVALSQHGSELLPLFLKKRKPDFIVLDGTMSEKSQNIVKERTRGYFDFKPLRDEDWQGIPHMNSNHDNMHAFLKYQAKPDLLLNIGTPRKLSKETLDIPTIGTINVHPGMLPKYRGCSAVEWALLNQDPVEATAHFMTEEYDAGDVICRSSLYVQPFEVYEQIRAKMINLWLEVMLEAIERVENGERGIPQEGESFEWPVLPAPLFGSLRRMLAQGEYKVNDKGCICAIDPFVRAGAVSPCRHPAPGVPTAGFFVD